MSQPSATIIIPGLEWNQDWLRHNLISYLDTNWIDQFYLDGTKYHHSLQWSDVLNRYLLDTSFLYKVLQLLKLDIKHAVLVSPVSQAMRLHHMSILCGNEILDISDTEANILCEQLNQLYQQDNYCFHVASPDLWVLESPVPLIFDSPCPYDVADLVDYQIHATGKDGDKIKLFQSEIQMFLYDSTVNQQRKKTSKFPINGVWLWNDIKNHANNYHSDLIINSSNIAWLYSQAPTAIESTKSRIIQAVQANRSIVFFSDQLYCANRILDFENYCRQFALLGKYIIEPILHMKQEKVISKISLVSCGQSGGIIELYRKKSFSFFKKIPYQGRWID